MPIEEKSQGRAAGTTPGPQWWEGGTYYPQFHLLTRAPFPEEKKDHSLTFNTTHPYSDQLLLWYVLFDISEADGDEALGTFSEHNTQSFFVKQMDLSVGCRVTL